MGYVREKYTKAYFLKKDATGKPTDYGAEGIGYFETGKIRPSDLDILERINFQKRIVLDVGFGRGEALKYAIEAGAQRAIGVDFSVDANKIAKRYLEQYKIEADLYCRDILDFLKYDIGNLKIKHIDIVLMLDVVEHIPRVGLTEVLSLLSRVLSERAIVVINTPVYPVDNDVISEGVNPLAHDPADDIKETEGMHCNRYSIKSLKKYMNDCGLEPISGHFYIRRVPEFRTALEQRGNWINAVQMGYPLIMEAIDNPEIYEIVNPDTYKVLRARETKPNMHKRVGLVNIRLIKTVIKFLLKKLHLLNFVKSFRKSPPKIDVAGGDWVKVKDGPLKGCYLFLNLQSPAYWNREMMEGRYDSFIYEALDERGSIEAATIWDVGAHIGYHSLAFAVLVGPCGHVVAFEPNPYNAERFRKNLRQNPELIERVSLINYALSNEDGEATFVLSSEVDNGRSSGSHLTSALVPEKQAAYQSFSQIHVRTMRGDTILSRLDYPPPSIIKIDVEGAEFDILKGCEGLLSTHKPILFLEIHNITLMLYVQEFLFELDYDLAILESEHSSTSRCFVVAKPKVFSS